MAEFLSGRIGRKPTLRAGWLVNHQGLCGKLGSSDAPIVVVALAAGGAAAAGGIVLKAAAFDDAGKELFGPGDGIRPADEPFAL